MGVAKTVNSLVDLAVTVCGFAVEPWRCGMLRGMKLGRTAPVFQVSDVGATMKWYEEAIGFSGGGFPKSPPFVFGIMTRDEVEIMLQRVEDFTKVDTYDRRDGGCWHVYVRMEGVKAFYDLVKARADVTVLEPLRRQPYGDTEFVVKDPNGYVLVFSELVGG